MTVLPEKCVRVVQGAIVGKAHDLTARVDGNCKAARITIQRPKVSHPTVLRKKCMQILRVWQLRLANHFPGFIEPDHFDKAPSQGAKVSEYSFVPEERMKRGVTGQG